MRLEPYARRKRILWAAMRLARLGDYRRVTRLQVAGIEGCSTSLVTYYFKTQRGLHDAIVQESVALQDLTILAQGLIAKNRYALAAPAKLKFRAIQGILK